MVNKVFQFSKYSGRFIAKYNSIKEASEKTKIDGSAISKVCKGVRKSAGEYVWKYEKDIKLVK